MPVAARLDMAGRCPRIYELSLIHFSGKQLALGFCVEQNTRRAFRIPIVITLFMPNAEIKRKVFITYSHFDELAVNQFINKWAYAEGVFVPKALGVRDDDDFINSDDPEYVMARIREKYVGDSSVTIVLIGSCTHSRRYVDWEIKASLRQARDGLPNGLLGILLPPLPRAHLPDRFAKNLRSPDRDGYAPYFYPPSTAQELTSWIENAFRARSTRAQLIVNPQDMMHYNSSCLVHHVSH